MKRTSRQAMRTFSCLQPPPSLRLISPWLILSTSLPTPLQTPTFLHEKHCQLVHHMLKLRATTTTTTPHLLWHNTKEDAHFVRLISPLPFSFAHLPAFKEKNGKTVSVWSQFFSLKLQKSEEEKRWVRPSFHIFFDYPCALRAVNVS